MQAARSGTIRSAETAPTSSVLRPAGIRPITSRSEQSACATASGSARSFTRRQSSKGCMSRRTSRCSGTRHWRRTPAPKPYSPYARPSRSRTPRRHRREDSVHCVAIGEFALTEAAGSASKARAAHHREVPPAMTDVPPPSPAMTDLPPPPPAGPDRTPSLLDACIPAVALIVFLATSYLLYGDKAAQGPNQIALLFCGLIACGIAVKNGVPWSALRQATADGIASALSAI